MIEHTLAYKYVKALLEGDNDSETGLMTLYPGGTLKFFAGRKRRDGLKVYTIMSHDFGEDVNPIGQVRALNNAAFLIETIGVNVGLEAVVPIANRIDDLLKGAIGQVVDGKVYVGRFVRQNDTDRDEDYDNQYYIYVGGLYNTVVYEYSGG